ncbi:hypothetical protein K3N28_05850 [Glycomyces sp. TRM65418]|uniref:DddA-like double-stranded DNA deaminase toxin n=1 Tax=Glycomyces sp. TRM65418 TaxID=2867006 RepID=UPI001CE65FC0|nr:DddA-like double-stranded DNA deaminase toxin [Glycomyces sp. TRM65418]MCC3762592.1 hypothetical protein [Glycomyces sp. TRM65418]QZD56631.1 hypothetical protein K3N28_05810 [Glycomyces sp. TRM65418]
MPSIDTLITTIRSMIDRSRELLTQLGNTKDQIAEVRGRVAALGFENCAALLDTLSDRMGESQAQAVGVGERLEAALAAVEGARGQGGTGTAGSNKAIPATPTPSPEPDRPWSRNSPVPNFRPDRPNPTCIEETRRVGWPINRNGRVSARGRLYDRDGRPITGTVQAGTGPADHARDLREPWASDERMTTRWHIEGHAAAIMRQHQVKETVLCINIPPCGSEDQDQWRCDANIAKILPQGSTLRIWAARQNGYTERFIYRGTGEALK